MSYQRKIYANGRYVKTIEGFSKRAVVQRTGRFIDTTRKLLGQDLEVGAITKRTNQKGAHNGQSHIVRGGRIAAR